MSVNFIQTETTEFLMSAQHSTDVSPWKPRSPFLCKNKNEGRLTHTVLASQSGSGMNEDDLGETEITIALDRLRINKTCKRCRSIHLAL
ncbi:hypothetical protein T4E_1458 [Trichinella pseudospiralis]|uniref:Uncharacterized protein n=1 Tax=Trichinella pseudospiralis TaxID=6337 RepID=A0A0V0Y863_TRIPS|nr:hypothetical protein T4E_1458 [Trichinella pseudospiralis]